jgi:hypothetical protein
MSMSPCPSPSRSTSLRFGSSVLRLTRELNGRKGSQPSASSCSNRPGADPSLTTVGQSVAGQIHKLRWSSRKSAADRWTGRHELLRREIDWFPADGTDVALVEPFAGLFCQDSGNTLPVQVNPGVAGAVDTDGQVLRLT